MSLVPDSKSGKILFFQAHLDKWAENAELLGFSPEQVAEMAALTAAARDALKAQGEAQSRAQAATARLRSALEAMCTAGAAMISIVRTKAQTSGGEVYQLANVPAPARPSPIGKPGEPYKFFAELWSNGWIRLKWKCKHPRGAVGTMYKIERAVQFVGQKSEGPFTHLGESGKKRYIDTTTPTGAQRIVYRVRAFRSTGAGQPQTHSVSLTGGGEMVMERVSRAA